MGGRSGPCTPRSEGCRGQAFFFEAEVQKMRVEMASMKRDAEHSSCQEHMELEKLYRELTDLLVGCRMHVQITRIDEAKNDLVLSEKEAWELLYLKEGTLLEGTVKKIFPYGAQVRIGETNRSLSQLQHHLPTHSLTHSRLEIRQLGEGIHHVPGLVEAHVNNMSEVWEVLQTGSNARAVGSTNANEHSSRSHCIHCVMVKGENLLNGECTRSKLWLVDLAGSERVAKTEVQGERLKETQNINRSLSSLGTRSLPTCFKTL